MITSYSAEYKDAMRERFFEKFNGDERPFAIKLREIYLPKGTYSSLLNGRHEISKHTLEIMRAYLEGRKPKFKTLDPATQGYCVSCERLHEIAEMKTRWECGACRNATNQRSKRKHWDVYLQLGRKRRMKFLIRGPAREAYLLTRKRQYLNKAYGKFGPVVELINRIKEEVKEYENRKA